MKSFFALVLSFGIGVAVLFFVQDRSMKSAPDYDVDRVVAEVVEVTPVGHRRYTSYAVELKLPDERVIFKDWDNPPTGKTVYLYSYVDNEGKLQADGRNPNDDYKAWVITGWIGAAIAGLFAWFVAALIMVGTLESFSDKKRRALEQRMIEDHLRKNPHTALSVRRGRRGR